MSDTMKCSACKPDYCACADFFAAQRAYWRGELPLKPPSQPRRDPKP